MEAKAADSYAVSAGKKNVLFTLQAIDSVCEWRMLVQSPTAIDYEIKTRLQLAGSAFLPSESFSAEFDDNFPLSSWID